MGEGMKELRRRVSEMHNETTANKAQLCNIMHQLDNTTRTYYEAEATGTGNQS